MFSDRATCYASIRCDTMALRTRLSGLRPQGRTMDDHKKLRVHFSVGTQKFALDEEYHRLTRGAARVRIEPQSFDLLLLLVRNQGHPVTHNALKKWFRARDDATAAEAGLKKGGGQK